MKKRQIQNSTKLALFLTLLSLSLQSCPEGCYACEFEERELPKRPNSRRIRKRIKTGKNGYKITCKGCWHDRLGEPGCPPKGVFQDKCLLYYKSGICIVCQKGYIPKTFADNGYLNSKCVESQEPSVVWGFYDHQRKREFMRVCDGKFPIQLNSRCVKFGVGDFLSKNCKWGSGHRGCQKCFRCKKGFVSIYGVCRRRWIGIEGCMNALNEDYCAYCDHWREYYMDYPGHCKKYKKKSVREAEKKRCENKFLKKKNTVLMNYAMFD